MYSFKNLLCLSTLLITPALFADAFVGKVSFAMTTSKGKTMVMNQSFKGTAVRTDMDGSPGGMIMDFGKKEMIILMTERHMYMVRPMNPADIPQEIKDKPAANNRDVEATGKTENILGYTCHQIITKDAKSTTEIWLAEGLGMYFAMSPGGGSPFGKHGNANSDSAAKWEKALKGNGGFPLLVITHDTDGKETFRMEATKIEKGGVTDADFDPPADFQKFEIPNMSGMNPFR